MFVLFTEWYFDYRDNRKTNTEVFQHWIAVLIISPPHWRFRCLLLIKVWRTELWPDNSPGHRLEKKTIKILKWSKFWEIFILTISKIWSGLGGNLNNPASKYLDIWENHSPPAWTELAGVVWCGVLPRPVSHLILRRIIILMFPFAVYSVFRASESQLCCLVLAMCSLFTPRFCIWDEFDEDGQEVIVRSEVFVELWTNSVPVSLILSGSSNLFLEFRSKLLEDLGSHDDYESVGQLSCQILIDLSGKFKTTIKTEQLWMWCSRSCLLPRTNLNVMGEF